MVEGNDESFDTGGDKDGAEEDGEEDEEEVDEEGVMDGVVIIVGVEAEEVNMTESAVPKAEEYVL